MSNSNISRHINDNSRSANKKFSNMASIAVLETFKKVRIYNLQITNVQFFTNFTLVSAPISFASYGCPF